MNQEHIPILLHPLLANYVEKENLPQNIIQLIAINVQLEPILQKKDLVNVWIARQVLLLHIKKAIHIVQSVIEGNIQRQNQEVVLLVLQEKLLLMKVQPLVRFVQQEQYQHRIIHLEVIIIVLNAVKVLIQKLILTVV